MISSILKIRFKQLIRIVNSLGIGRFIFIVIVLAMIFLFVFMSIKSREGDYFTGSIWLVLILVLHLKRKDLTFMRSHIERFRLLLFIEYSLISIPVIGGLIYWNKYAEFAVFLILLTGIALSTKSIRKLTLNTWLQRLIPDQCFEWKSGIRSSLLLLVPLYIIGIAVSGWPATVPVVMILLGLITVGFNEKNEPLPMLLVFERSPNNLLLIKIRNHLLLFSLFVVPLMIVYLVRNPEYWYIVTIIFLLNILIQSYSVLTKYSFYQPHVLSGNQIFNILGSVSILVPLLIPLVIVLGIRFYFKSVNNLNQYLHDFR